MRLFVASSNLPRVRLRLADPGPLQIALRTFFFAPKGGTRVTVEQVTRARLE